MLLTIALSYSACGNENVLVSTELPVENPVPDPKPESNPGSGNYCCLVVYFSCTSVTKNIAEQIADITNGNC